jgi:stage II sporulation protein P
VPFQSYALAAYEGERTDGQYYTLVDDKGHVLHCTALAVYAGDEYITPDNRRFKVVRIQGDKALCHYVGREEMPDSRPLNSSAPLGLTPVAAFRPETVGIYHTHSDESYVPSDGTESREGRGGIYQVGEALKDKLSNLGIRTLYDKTPHDPHDINSYQRSRKTAVALLRKGAAALIDVHRDAVPPQVYQTNVKGTKVTRVKLVIGRQNPHMQANLAFAKKIKAYLDKNEPGLSAGIYIGKGNYNQDLTSRAVLIEVGAHTNSKLEAENGVKMFASVLPQVLGAPATPGLRQVGQDYEQKNNWWSIILAIAIAGALYGAYVYMNRGRVGGS